MSRLIREDVLKAKLLSEWVRDIDVVDAFLEELPGYEEPDWTEIFEDDERTFPPVDEEGEVKKMTFNGAIMQLVELVQHPMMPKMFQSALDKVIETLSEVSDLSHPN